MASKIWTNVILSAGMTSGYYISSFNHKKAAKSESFRDHEFGVPQDRKRVDLSSPFFPSDKHPCTYAGMFIPGCHELKIFSGSSHFELADDIARRLGTYIDDLKLCSIDESK